MKKITKILDSVMSTLKRTCVAKAIAVVAVATIAMNSFLTSSSCHPKIFVKEFSYFLMSCHQHCLGINLLVQR